MGLVPKDSPVASPSHTVAGRCQEQLRDFYYSLLSRYHRPDLVVVDGDAIDGPGRKNHGMEQLTTDMAVQSDMAYEALAPWSPTDGYRVLSGSGYHVDGYGAMERTLASRLGARYSDDDYFTVEGVPMHARHFVSVSGSQNTQASLLSSDAIKMILARETIQYPEARVIVRAHVHSYMYVGTGRWIAMTLPALQLPFGIYGSRIPPKVYDVGLVIMDITKSGGISWHPELMSIKVDVPESDHYSLRGR